MTLSSLHARTLSLLSLLLCVVGFGMATGPARGADAAPGAGPAAGDRPKVALVLSGGGARGLTHVGVLKVLEASRVPVDMVVGTSMGAIIGGLWAAGMSTAELEAAVTQLDWGGLFEWREPRQLLSQRRKDEDFELAPILQLGFRDGEFRLPTGAVPSRSLEMLLRRYTLPMRDLPDFDHLPIPFRAVATDMETGEAVVLDQGDLAAALRASMSVPGVFAPLEVDGRILGDGGLVDNLPVAVARRMGAEVVIAVNIGTPLAGRETLGTLVGITSQMIQILTEQNVRHSISLLTPEDLLLVPPLGQVSSADFGRAAELVALGERYAESVRASLARFAVPEPVYAQWQQVRAQRLAAASRPTGPVAAVRFEGVPEARTAYLRSLMETRPGTAFDLERVEGDVQRLAATGDYDDVGYRLERGSDGAGETLVVRAQDNSWGPNYLKMGLSLETDFDGEGAFTLRMSHNRHWINDLGAEWRNRIQLGEQTGYFTEFYQPLTQRAGSFGAVYLDTRLERATVYGDDGEAVATGRRRSLQLGADVGWPMGLLGNYGEFRIGLAGRLSRAVPELLGAGLDEAGVALRARRWTEHGLRMALTSDQLDYANFPLHGYRIRGELMVGRLREKGAPGQLFNRLDTELTAAHSWGRHTLNLGLRAAHASKVPVGAIDEYALGGFQQLSGYHRGQVSGNYLLYGRLSYYHRTDYGAGLGLLRALFVGGSLELGNAWNRRSEVSLGDLRTGSSLFVGADTGLGPLYLALVYAPQGHTGVYLMLGRPGGGH
jgi:NTE family protein